MRERSSPSGRTLRCGVHAGTWCLSFALATGMCEVVVRSVGLHPWTRDRTHKAEPTMHESDPLLGWQNKRGYHVVPPYHPEGTAIEVTFLEHGRRRTGPAPVMAPEGDLLLVGDSYTQGWAISDSETYAWRLQERFPSLQVLNYGTAAYGTYQSLLMLERELPRSASPRVVLYGFYDHHEDRNVALHSWLRGLASSRRGYVNVPYATYDPASGLRRHPPERYVELPFREWSALVPLVETVYMKIKTMRRSWQKRLVTERLIAQMKQEATARGAAFAVVMLSLNDEAKRHYLGFFDANDIPAIDCVYDLTDEMKVPGEGHPNAKLNRRWAECIAAGILPLTRSKSPS